MLHGLTHREARDIRATEHDGETFNEARDAKRLTCLRERVLSYMLRHGWVTLDELVRECGGTTASVSAKVRDLRKLKYGGWSVLSHCTNQGGLWLYRVEHKAAP